MNDDSDTWWSVFQRVLAEPRRERTCGRCATARLYCARCLAALERLMDRAELAADEAAPLIAAARMARVASERAAADARAAKKVAKAARRRWVRSRSGAEWRARQKAGEA
jgi:hypothetical protein